MVVVVKGMASSSSLSVPRVPAYGAGPEIAPWHAGSAEEAAKAERRRKHILGKAAAVDADDNPRVGEQSIRLLKQAHIFIPGQRQSPAIAGSSGRALTCCWPFSRGRGRGRGRGEGRRARDA